MTKTNREPVAVTPKLTKLQEEVLAKKLRLQTEMGCVLGSEIKQSAFWSKDRMLEICRLKQERNIELDKLNALVKEEIIYEANLKGSLDRAIASYQENNRFFSYLINLPKTLESFATATDTLFSAQYKDYDKKATDVIKKCFVSGSLPQHRVRHSDNICFVLWTQYKKNSVFDTLNEIYKLYKEHGIIKLSLIEIVRQIFYRERKMIVRAIVAMDLATTLKSEDFVKTALQELKNKIKKDRDRIANLIGGDYVVFPAVRKKELWPEDFIGEASIRSKAALKRLTGDRKNLAEEILKKLRTMEQKIKDEEDADDRYK